MTIWKVSYYETYGDGNMTEDHSTVVARDGESAISKVKKEVMKRWYYATDDESDETKEKVRVTEFSLHRLEQHGYVDFI